MHSKLSFKYNVSKITINEHQLGNNTYKKVILQMATSSAIIIVKIFRKLKYGCRNSVLHFSILHNQVEFIDKLTLTFADTIIINDQPRTITNLCMRRNRCTQKIIIHHKYHFHRFIIISISNAEYMHYLTLSYRYYFTQNSSKKIKLHKFSKAEFNTNCILFKNLYS